MKNRLARRAGAAAGVLGWQLWRRRRAWRASQSHFQGQVALVTGGASGIGRALCLALAARGARVVVADLNDAGAVQTAAAIQAAGGHATAVSVDVTDAAAVDALIDGVVAENGRVDFIFNNAGIGLAGPTDAVTPAQWAQVLAVNLHGVVYGTRKAYRVMRQQGFGHIVNTASLAGLIPFVGGATYAMTKHGVVGLSTSLRVEAAAHGVRVSALCPGFIDTPILTNSMAAGGGRVAPSPLNRLRLPTAEACAAAALRGVAANRGIIPIGGMAHVLWAVQRLNPAWLEALLARLMPRVMAGSQPG